MTILDKIAANRRIEIETLKLGKPLESFIGRLEALPAPRFKAEVGQSERINIIAEIKKGSPSKGILCADLKPTELAGKYEAGGATAISVLTESKHFFGRYEYLEQVRKQSTLPILCKDFVVDSYQLYHAKLLGADAALLIVALHDPQMLKQRLQLAAKIGLDCLVEVHDDEELSIAIDSGAEIIGVNNRNLKDFVVTLETSARLAEAMPDSIVKVSESGIHSYQDIVQLRQSDYNCFLIGEALVTSDDPVAELKSLRGV